MREIWYHYRCADGHEFRRQAHADKCECGARAHVTLKERVPMGYYTRSRERRLKCDRCGEVASLLIQNGVNAVACTIPDCSGQMHPLVEGVPYLPVADLAMGESATRAAIDKWQKQRAEKQKIEERTINEHGSL